jgi:hypothetical protein
MHIVRFFSKEKKKEKIINGVGNYFVPQKVYFAFIYEIWSMKRIGYLRYFIIINVFYKLRDWIERLYHDHLPVK